MSRWRFAEFVKAHFITQPLLGSMRFQLLFLIYQYVLEFIWCLKLGHTWDVWLFFEVFVLSLLWSCLILQPWLFIGRCLRVLDDLAAVVRSIARVNLACTSWGTSNSFPVSWSSIIGWVSHYLINILGILHILFEVLAQLHDVGLCLFLMLLWYSIDIVKQLGSKWELLFRNMTRTIRRSLSLILGLRKLCSAK